MQTSDEFTQLFMAEYGAVTRTVWFILRDRHQAEDVTQEAFAQLHVHWKKVSTFQRPDAWVRRVGESRLAVRYAKRESRRKELERETEPANPSVPEMSTCCERWRHSP